MNRYVDERVAFSYPEELRCTREPDSNTYHLRRGPLHISLCLPEPGFWQTLFHQAGRVRQLPRGEEWSEEYAEHGFRGRAKSSLARGRSGGIYGKQVDLVLSRGEWRVWLRIGDDKDFPMSLVAPILGTMAFPGEALYEESRRLGTVEEQVPSPYVISLRHFPKFGRENRESPAEFDAMYAEDAVSDQQLRAVERFIADEGHLFEQARLAIFRYYTEGIYPMSSQIGRYDDLWPACQTADEVMRLVYLSSLMVHEPRDDGAAAIGLRFHCSWDVEHGLGLRAVGSTIEAIGSDFVALAPRGGGEWPGFRETPGDPAH